MKTEVQRDQNSKSGVYKEAIRSLVFIYNLSS